jgi:Cu/Ag efflux protein CusF
MTMPFRVKDPALLERIKTGDKIKFAIENEDGKLMIVDIVPATRGGTKGNTAGGRR